MVLYNLDCGTGPGSTTLGVIILGLSFLVCTMMTLDLKTQVSKGESTQT